MQGLRYAESLKVEALREMGWYGHSSGSHARPMAISTPLFYACIRLQSEQQSLRNEIDALREQVRQLEGKLESTESERDVLRNAHRVLSVTLGARRSGPSDKGQLETRRGARARARRDAEMDFA